MKLATGLLLLLLPPALLLVAPLAGGPHPSCSAPAVDSTSSVSVAGQVAGQLDADQRANAEIIVDAALDRGLGRAGAVIGVMTALTESSLRNLSYGDQAGPDSRGLFQQRSTWGPLGLRMSPAGSSGLFFNALQAVPGWRSMQPWEAAQVVQRSAFADGANYRTHYPIAARLVANTRPTATAATRRGSANAAPVTAVVTTAPCPGQTTNVVAQVQLPPAPAPYRGGSTGCVIADPTGTGGCVTGATAHLLVQTQAAFGSEWPWGIACWDEHSWSPGSDHPLGRACDFTVGELGHYPNQAQSRAGWALAEWLRAYATRLDVEYVIWDGRIWSTSYASQGWRPYDGGGIYDLSTPSGAHRDHVHVSLEH